MALMDVGFFSETLGMCVHCAVILPQSTPDRPLGQRKTLYLLHGYGGSYTSWIRNTGIERYAARYHLAVVMPDAQKSAYADMSHGGRFFHYIAEELPDKMRGFFPLSDQRADNFVAGFSMGGFGALKIGLARPERFSAIGCISAGMHNDTPDTHALYERRLGGRELAGTEEDLIGNAQRIAGGGQAAPRIFHRVGQDDFLLPCARETRDVLSGFAGDPFLYDYREMPGRHSWSFCEQVLPELLQWLCMPPQKA